MQPVLQNIEDAHKASALCRNGFLMHLLRRRHAIVCANLASVKQGN